MLKPESVQENEIHKTLSAFEISRITEARPVTKEKVFFLSWIFLLQQIP